VNEIATKRIIHHDLTNYYSLVIRELAPGLLLVDWEEVQESYQITQKEFGALKKAVDNYIKKHEPVYLLVDTYPSIIVDHSVLNKLQDKTHFENINAVALVLHSTTHRLSLNLSSQFNRTPIPIRGFTTRASAEKWLKKQMAE